MGIIREVQETATNITYKIDDMTGEFVTVKVSILLYVVVLVSKGSLF